MIRAVVFDMDDTLVQTEQLKALSYARAASQLRPGEVTELEVVDAFKDLVGRPREVVVSALMERFALRAAAQARLQELGGETPEEAFSNLRLKDYEEMLGDAQLLKSRELPYAVRLVEVARDVREKTGLATMSHRDQVDRVLDVLGLSKAFDSIATREVVTHGKPDPEIYVWSAHALGVAPTECLVIEDSPSGVRAAIAAGARVIAVPTDYSRDSFRDGALLDRRWVVEDPKRLEETFQRALDES
ncbi:MAG TPA: HAD family phosphatase [bacterium]|nr:HAD family phosphatase [bacterium]